MLPAFPDFAMDELSDLNSLYESKISDHRRGTGSRLDSARVIGIEKSVFIFGGIHQSGIQVDSDSDTRVQMFVQNVIR